MIQKDFIRNLQLVKFQTSQVLANREVRVLTKIHYGTSHYYPSNRTATLFLRIQGGKTLTKDTLRLLIAEGFDVKFDYEEEVL